jgi:hypothetical protein
MTTTYTYNSSGQLTSIDGPRTDVADVVGLAYYPNEEGQGHNRGQLHTVPDAMGHATTFADYNAFGQAETLTDPNGIVSVREIKGVRVNFFLCEKGWFQASKMTS